MEMQSYSKFSTPTAGTMAPMSVPDDSPDNAIKDRVQIAEAKAAVKTLLKHVNSLDEFAVNTHQKADSAFFDVRGEIANLHCAISGVHTLFEQLDERVTKLESVNEEKGAWCALGLGCTPHRTRTTDAKETRLRRSCSCVYRGEVAGAQDFETWPARGSNGDDDGRVRSVVVERVLAMKIGLRVRVSRRCLCTTCSSAREPLREPLRVLLYAARDTPSELRRACCMPPSRCLCI